MSGEGQTLTSSQFLQKQIDIQSKSIEKLREEVESLKKQALIKTRILEEQTAVLSTMAKNIEGLYNDQSS